MGHRGRTLAASLAVSIVIGVLLFQFHATKLVMVPCTGEWAGPACDALARVETADPFIPAPYIVLIAVGFGALAYWLLGHPLVWRGKGRHHGG